MELNEFLNCNGKTFFVVFQKSVCQVQVIGTSYVSPHYDGGEPYLEATVCPLNNPHHTFTVHPNSLYTIQDECEKALEESLKVCSLYDQTNAAYHIAHAVLALQGYKDEECMEIAELLRDILNRVNNIRTNGTEN